MSTHRMGYVERNSPLHRMDGLSKLLFLLLFLISVIVTQSVGGFLLLIAALLLCARLGKVSWQTVLGGIWQLRFFFLLIFLMNFAFFDAEHAFFSWWIFTFSREGLLFGAKTVVRVLLAMAVGNIFTAVTTPVAITGAMETLLYPLQWIGVPVRDVAMILGVAIQFVPLFLRETDTIKMAQTARGAPFYSRKLSERAGCVLPLVLPVFLSAFKRADELACAMEARGYVRKKGRMPLHRRHFRKADFLCLGGGIALCMLAIFVFR